MTDADPIIDLLRSFAIRPGPHRIVDFIDALTVFDGDHIAALTEALTDEDDEVRLVAIEVLGEMAYSQNTRTTFKGRRCPGLHLSAAVNLSRVGTRRLDLASSLPRKIPFPRL